MASDATLEAGDLEMLDRLAQRVVELHLELPAILTLETGKPLSLLAGQTLVFFEPIVQSLFPWSDYRRFAQVIERREAVEALIQRIERRADEAQAARRAPKPGPPPDESSS
jgi:acyl-CoA reductase-like NAD-dependent aldehyde dehydrogenase